MCRHCKFFDENYTIAPGYDASLFPYEIAEYNPYYDLWVSVDDPWFTVPGLTVEKLQAEYAKMRDEWYRSESRKDCLRILSNDGQQWNVTEAICLGTSNFSKDHSWGTWQDDQRVKYGAARVSGRQVLAGYAADCLRQLVVFMGITEILSDTTDGPIEIFAQDPEYTALDKEFLRSLNVTVLEMPQAEQRISSDTFVFAQCLERTVLFPHVLKNLPGLFVGNDPRDFFRKMKKRDKPPCRKYKEKVKAYYKKRDEQGRARFEQRTCKCNCEGIDRQARVKRDKKILAEYEIGRKIVVEPQSTMWEFGMNDTFFAWEDPDTTELPLLSGLFD